MRPIGIVIMALSAWGLVLNLQDGQLPEPAFAWAPGIGLLLYLWGRRNARRYKAYHAGTVPCRTCGGMGYNGVRMGRPGDPRGCRECRGSGRVQPITG